MAEPDEEHWSAAASCAVMIALWLAGLAFIVVTILAVRAALGW